jgi:hypothetical protein
MHFLDYYGLCLSLSLKVIVGDDSFCQYLINQRLIFDFRVRILGRSLWMNSEETFEYLAKDKY